ncbi:restriction endonuclease subunit S [Komagataeibacter europaeus]|uniref:restriction endonuclease subunit S n=1 Tax=Komagataeibacter europaeus TaxID=33995 RepID=UPI0002DBF734|nr:restriction endonuclease subunit S [Komagataeibacter europaeus]
MSWPTATLDSISEVVRGVTFSKADAESDPREGLLPVLRAGNIAETLNIESDLVYVDQGRISEKQILRPKDIVVCTSSGSASVLGKSAMLGQEWQGSFGAFLATVRTASHVADPDFVGHYLRSPRFRAWASNSAGIGIKNIRASDLKKIEIPLPPLEEQKRIAGILDQAAELCRLRTRALDRLGTLGQAIFHEMFGASDGGIREWPMATLGELVADAQIGAVRGASEMSDEKACEYLRMDAIGTDGSLDLNDLRRVDASDHDLEKYGLRCGDLLFNTRNSKDLVGKTAVLRQDFRGIYNNNILRCRFVLPSYADFFDAYLRTSTGSHSLENIKSGTTSVFAVYQKALMSLRVPVPDEGLTKEFARA